MQKPVKIAIGIIGFFALLLIGLSIFLKIFLSGDRLKAIILPTAESVTGRKVNLEDINVSLFKGVVAKGLSVKEKDGQGDFLKVKEFILSYQFLPLLKKQLVISKIEVVSPSVSIRRYKEARYNFSDLTEQEPSPSQKRQESEPQGLPVSLVADKLLIRDAQFSFVDEERALPDLSGNLDMEFKGSIGKEGVPRLEKGRISIKEVKVRIKDMEVRTTGDIDIDPKDVQAKLQAFIGKENIEITATVKDYLSAPDVRGDIHARSLDLEKWMALGSEKKAPGEQASKKEQKAERTEEGSIQKMNVKGRITVDEAKYQEYRIKGVRLDYSYARGALKLDPLGLQFSGGNVFSMEGTAQGNFQLTVGEGAAMQKNLRGKGVVTLGKGKINESKIFDGIALLIGIPELRRPEIDEGVLKFDVMDERINLDGMIRSSLFKLTPKGTVDFEKRLDILTGLRLSPNLTGRLGKNLLPVKFMEDEQGWKIIPLKMRGTIPDPRVTLDEEALKRQIGSGLKGALEKLIQAPTAQEEGKPSKRTSPKDLLKDLFGK